MRLAVFLFFVVKSEDASKVRSSSIVEESAPAAHALNCWGIVVAVSVIFVENTNIFKVRDRVERRLVAGCAGGLLEESGAFFRVAAKALRYVNCRARQKRFQERCDPGDVPRGGLLIDSHC